jgi:hypothetical protein
VWFVWSGWGGRWKRVLAREWRRDWSGEESGKAEAVVGNCMRGVVRGRIVSERARWHPNSFVVLLGGIGWSWRGRRCSRVSGVSEGRVRDASVRCVCGLGKSGFVSRNVKANG